jgi:hypothetical protein
LKSNNSPKIVSFLTNIDGMEQSTTRTRKFRETILVPMVANFYNLYKNGVDTCDHLIASIHHGHKVRHAYVAKGFHFLQLLWINAYLHARGQTRLPLRDFSFQQLWKFKTFSCHNEISLQNSVIRWCTRRTINQHFYCLQCSQRTRSQCCCGFMLCSDLCLVQYHNPDKSLCLIH